VSGTVRATLERASPARIARRPTRPQLIKVGITTVLLLFAFFALPELLSLYYVDTMTQVAVYSIVTLALGLLVGRVGLYSLGQAAVLAIGAWAAARRPVAATNPVAMTMAPSEGNRSAVAEVPSTAATTCMSR